MNHDLSSQAVKAGTLLCLFPGQVVLETPYVPSSSVINRPNSIRFDYSKTIYYPNHGQQDLVDIEKTKIDQKEINKHRAVDYKSVPGNYVNFYAIGNKINHFGEGKSPNVTFVDFTIPLDFFQQDWLRYLPILQLSRIEEKDGINVLAVVATREIQSGEELFADYIKEFWYDKDNCNQTDWLRDTTPLLENQRYNFLYISFSLEIEHGY